VGVVRQRLLVHVAGPPGAGKTTFVETMLAHVGQRVMIAARCQRDDALSEPRESRPTADPELGRYRTAGAMARLGTVSPAGTMPMTRSS
jgi:broad-specificity NMP kinase